MKRLLLGLVLVGVLLMAVSVSAEPPFTYITSGAKTSDGLIVAAGKLTHFGGIEAISNGSSNAVADVYCGISTGGVLLMRGATIGAGLIGGGMTPYPIECTKGLYLEVVTEGVSAKFILYYR